MPRRIDAEARTAEIAEASLRVLERDGLAGLSVRGVAAEAGIAAASLRRSFATQHALREYCLQLIEDRVTARISALELTGRALVDGLLLQLLPLDKERRLELVAQVQLGVLSLTDNRLRPPAIRLSEGVDRACHAAVQILIEAGLFNKQRDPVYEAQRLRALLDGIAMRGLWSGELPASSHMPGLLTRHLDSLANP
ncbi:TetR family transcriptional regulator C-terminal domain-containing protein [Arthrobacter sp. R3-55]